MEVRREKENKRRENDLLGGLRHFGRRNEERTEKREIMNMRQRKLRFICKKTKRPRSTSNSTERRKEYEEWIL